MILSDPPGWASCTITLKIFDELMQTLWKKIHAWVLPWLIHYVLRSYIDCMNNISGPKTCTICSRNFIRIVSKKANTETWRTKFKMCGTCAWRNAKDNSTFTATGFNYCFFISGILEFLESRIWVKWNFMNLAKVKFWFFHYFDPKRNYSGP